MSKLVTTRRRFFWVTLVLLTLGGVLVGLRSCSNSALQAYVTELRSRGEQLTWPELGASYSASPAGWVTEFTNQVAALGPSPVANPEKLHLAEFIEPNLARVTWSVSQLPWASADANQTNLSWLGLSRQLAAARPALRQLQEILRRPGLNSGPPTNYFDFRSLWQEMKSAAGWLACDTLVGLREDRKDDALASLRAIAGLATMHRQDCTLVQQMSRVAVANVGLDLTWEALQAEGWSEEQLSALQACWEQCDLIAAVELALLGERTLPLECLQMIRERPKRNGSVPGFSGFTKPTWPFNRGFHSYYRNVALPNDALYGLRYLQREVELIRQLRAGRPYHEVMVVFGEQEAALETKAKSVTRILYPISLICLPAYGKAVTRAAQVEVKRRLAITAVALRRYQLNHGHWPPDLASLTSKFLRNVPRDCMDGQPLKYRVKADGTFTLYSVGVDGMDQGGEPRPVKAGLTGLGEGLDAVWPAAQRPAQVPPRDVTSGPSL